MLPVSGYGQSGPYRDQSGFGVVAEAMGGLRHLTGEPGRVPVRAGVSMADGVALAVPGFVPGVSWPDVHRRVSPGMPHKAGRRIDRRSKHQRVN